MKFSIATLLTILVASVAAQDAFFFEGTNESCTVADDGKLNCEDGETPGAQHVPRGIEARDAMPDPEAVNEINARWPTLPTCLRGGNRACNDKCHSMGRPCGQCLGFVPTCYCRTKCY